VILKNRKPKLPNEGTKSALALCYGFDKQDDTLHFVKVLECWIVTYRKSFGYSNRLHGEIDVFVSHLRNENRTAMLYRSLLACVYCMNEITRRLKRDRFGDCILPTIVVE
jgi:hypothetical protein